MNRNRELIKNTIIFGIGNFGSKLILFLLVPLYTMVLTTEQFGIADLIQSSINLMWPLLSLGISEAIMRFILVNKDMRGDAILFGLIIVTISGLMLLLFTPLINLVEFFHGYAYLFPILYTSTAFKNMLGYFCKGIEKTTTYAIDGIITAITLTAGSWFLLIVLNLNVKGFLYSIILSNTISIIYLVRKCNLINYLSNAKINKSLYSNMINYSLPLLPNTISWWIIQISDRYILASICGVAITGLYSMAYRIPSIFNLIVSVFIQAWLMVVIKECENNSGGKYFSFIYKYYISITFVVSTLIVLSSRVIANIIFKNDFYQASIYVPILMLAFTIGNLQAFYGTIYSGLKKTKKVFVSTLCGAILNIILNILLIPSMGAYGAAVATVVSYLLVYIIRANDLKKYLDIDHEYRRISFALAILVAVVISYNSEYHWLNIASYLLGGLIIMIFRKEQYAIVLKSTLYIKKKFLRY